MSDRYPGYQHMISHLGKDEVLTLLRENRKVWGADAIEVWASGFVPYPPNDPSYRKGFRCSYRLDWNSYLGWKVYMLMTGCLASIPEEEEKLKNGL